jgi:ABC-type iron transport system FetAB ATPase subunit
VPENKELKEIVIRYNIAEKKLAFIWCFREKERAVRNLWSKINRTSPVAYWAETS